MTEAELSLCTHSCSIPTGSIQPSLNLSHAVCVILAQIFQHRSLGNTGVLPSTNILAVKSCIQFSNMMQGVAVISYAIALELLSRADEHQQPWHGLARLAEVAEVSVYLALIPVPYEALQSCLCMLSIRRDAFHAKQPDEGSSTIQLMPVQLSVSHSCLCVSSSHVTTVHVKQFAVCRTVNKGPANHSQASSASKQCRHKCVTTKMD